MVCWSELVSKSFSTRATQRIAKEMPHREITLCEDETFHPQICLVAIEPVSNYLILEEYAAKRDAPTWNVAISEALKPFSITVIQCVSDLATALISHAEIHLGVHHSPDLRSQDRCQSRIGPSPRKVELAFRYSRTSRIRSGP